MRWPGLRQAARRLLAPLAAALCAACSAAPKNVAPSVAGASGSAARGTARAEPPFPPASSGTADAGGAVEPSAADGPAGAVAAGDEAAAGDESDEVEREPGEPTAGEGVEAERPLSAASGAAALGGRWVLLPEEHDPGRVITALDGRRLLMLGGTRWVDYPDGSIESARQVLAEENVRSLELPERMGSGFVFYADSGHSTAIWRAESWIGDLKPLALVDPPVRAIVAGFDRLYLVGQTTHALRAIDAQTGAAKDLATLPGAASYAALAFADRSFGVVLADMRGALATFDAGRSWHTLPRPLSVRDLAAPGTLAAYPWLVSPQGLSPGAIAIDAEQGRFELAPSGLLRETSAEGSDALFRSAETFSRYGADAFEKLELRSPRPGPLGARPLRVAVQSGWPDSAETAVVLARGALGHVRLTDGKLLKLEADAYTEGGPCRGVALGSGFGFVCGDEDAPAQILAYAGGRVVLEHAFAEPRSVRSSGNGALVIEGPCASPRPAATEKMRDYCLRGVDGKWFDVRVRGELGRERVAALADGSAAVLLPPRSDDDGRLTLVSKSGKHRVVQLALNAVEPPRVRLLRSGLWLNDLVESASGELRTWVVGAQAFVGVSVARDGKVRVSKVEQGLQDTLFSGPHALHFVASASLRESVDHGFSWRTRDLPTPVLSTLEPSKPGSIRGCSRVGCIYDGWLRVGYTGTERPLHAVAPKRPEVVSHRPPGYAYWSLECTPTGIERAATAPKPRSQQLAAERRGVTKVGRGLGSEDLQSSSWLPFYGWAPPLPANGALAFDFGESTEGGAYRAYATGPRTGNWQRQGRWMARVLDPFSLDAAWSTAWSLGPWADSRVAAQNFGLDQAMSVEWTLELEAGGHAGALFLRAGSETTLHLLEAQHPILSLSTKDRIDVGGPAGAVKVAGDWYLGAFKNRAFSVYRVTNGQLGLVGVYPVFADDGRVSVRLIRNLAGDALAIWERSSASGWYIFPIDLETAEAREPRHVPIQQLGRMPAACPSEQAGWEIVANVPLSASGRSESNTRVEFSGAAAGIRTKALRARVMVDEQGICLDSLAARSDGLLPSAPRLEVGQPHAGSVQMTVSDESNLVRWGFRCL